MEDGAGREGGVDAAGLASMCRLCWKKKRSVVNRKYAPPLVITQCK